MGKDGGAGQGRGCGAGVAGPRAQGRGQRQAAPVRAVSIAPAMRAEISSIASL